MKVWEKWNRRSWKPAPGSFTGRVAAGLPVRDDAAGVSLGLITVEGLLHLQRLQWRDGMERMTCRPVTRRPDEEIGDFFRSRLDDPCSVLCGIYQEGPLPVGKITASDYNPRNGSAEIGYYLLPDYRGRGLMRWSVSALCGLLFERAGLRKVYAQTGSFNEASVRLLRGLGFHLDGVLREHHELNGEFLDDCVFSLLRREYGGAVPGGGKQTRPDKP